MHPAQHEVYLVTSGMLRLHTWRGNQHGAYLVGPLDMIVVPPGCCHFVEWETPGVAWVFKAPPLTGDVAKLLCDGPNAKCPFHA